MTKLIVLITLIAVLFGNIARVGPAIAAGGTDTEEHAKIASLLKQLIEADQRGEAVQFANEHRSITYVRQPATIKYGAEP